MGKNKIKDILEATTQGNDGYWKHSEGHEHKPERGIKIKLN